MTDAASERRARKIRQRYKRAGAATGVAAVGVVVGLIVSNSSASAATGYRTATAEYQTVQQTLAVTGDVEPAHDITATFQTSGKVSDVYATVGEKVTAGEKLATLDTTSLTESEQSAELALEGAEAALTENEDNESSGTSGSSGSGASGYSGADASTAAVTSAGVDAVLTAYTPPTGSGSNGSGSGGAKGSSGPTSLKAAQAAVVAAQKAVDTDTAAAKADLAQAQTDCSSSGSGSSAGSTGSTGDTSTSGSTTTSTTSDTTTTTTGTGDTTTTTTTPTGSSGSGTSSDATCTTDLQTAFAAQEQVSADETTLSTDETALAKFLSEEESSSSTTKGSGSSSFKSGSPSSSTSTKSGSTTTATYDSAEQLASDQATIDTDEANLIEAQQSLAAATLVAPLSGTVAAVDIASSDSVSSNSSSDGITIIDTSGYEVAASLADAQVQKIKVGASVNVTVDGVDGTITGSVTTIGPVTDDDDEYSYPVTIALDPPAESLSIGSSAQAAIVIGSASHVVSVPSSAVHTDDGSYVEVVKNGKMTEQKVTVGVVGTLWTQIDSGLSAGSQVVLADLATALPSSSTEQSTATRRFGGGAGFTVGGAGGAGFTARVGAGGGGFSGAAGFSGER